MYDDDNDYYCCCCCCWLCCRCNSCLLREITRWSLVEKWYWWSYKITRWSHYLLYPLWHKAVFTLVTYQWRCPQETSVILFKENSFRNRFPITWNNALWCWTYEKSVPILTLILFSNLSSYVQSTWAVCKTLSLSKTWPLSMRALQSSGRAETKHSKLLESVMDLKGMKWIS